MRLIHVLIRTKYKKILDWRANFENVRFPEKENNIPGIGKIKLSRLHE